VQINAAQADQPIREADSATASAPAVAGMTAIRGTPSPTASTPEVAIAEAHLRAVLDASPDGLIISDTRGTIVMVSAEAERMFGHARDELVGRPVELLVPERSRERHPDLRAGYLANPRARPMGSKMELHALRKDGSEFPVEISLSPIDVGGDLLVASAVRDVTDRKNAEAELRRAKDDLANMVIHDLKNPVTGILMLVQLALRKGDGLAESHRRNFEQISRTSREMLRLILNLLEISKIEEGRMPVVREPVGIAEIAAEVAREYAPVAAEMDKVLRVHVDPTTPAANADAVLLKRVLTNLVVNGLRHSGGREVAIDATGTAGETVVVRVRDHGRGIPAGDRSMIFEKFASVQRSLTANAVSDTGLGLPFCKLAVERMGGTIELASSADGETIFAVTLPAHTAPPSPPR
jgi:protein-histidine pros-kinase